VLSLTRARAQRCAADGPPSLSLSPTHPIPQSLSLSPHPSSAEADGLIALTTVWSRSESAAASLAADLGPHVAAAHGDAGLAAILADGGTDALLVILPVQAMPGVVTAALAAGKAVLQEKPVAPTVKAATEVAKAALAARRKAEADSNTPLSPLVLPVWCLAENYRSEPGVAATAAATRTLRSVIKIDLVANMPMDGANRYHGSAWRRDTAGCPGGFLMDSSVHFIAALRSVAGRGGARWGEARAASAAAYGADAEDSGVDGGVDGSHHPPPLPAPDTLVGRLTFANGRAAAVSITFAGAAPGLSLGVEGRDGAVQLTRGGLAALAGSGCKGGANPTAARGAGYEVTTAHRAPGGGLAAETVFHPFAGLERELRAFVRLARGVAEEGDAAALCPAAAARDLAVVEALLVSAAAGGGAPVPVLPLAPAPWGQLQAAEAEEDEEDGDGVCQL
jgi:predicted dehydrogenase